MATKTGTREQCGRCGRFFKNLANHLRQSDCGGQPPAVAPEATADPNSLPPGTIVGRGKGSPRKVPWTQQHLEKLYPKKLITNPPESCPVTVNGVTYYIRAGEDIEVPSIVAEIYINAMRNKGLPILRAVGSTWEERAKQVYHQGYGLLEPLPEEG